MAKKRKNHLIDRVAEVGTKPIFWIENIDNARFISHFIKNSLVRKALKQPEFKRFKFK